MLIIRFFDLLTEVATSIFRTSNEGRWENDDNWWVFQRLRYIDNHRYMMIHVH